MHLSPRFSCICGNVSKMQMLICAHVHIKLYTWHRLLLRDVLLSRVRFYGYSITNGCFQCGLLHRDMHPHRCMCLDSGTFMHTILHTVTQTNHTYLFMPPCILLSIVYTQTPPLCLPPPLSLSPSLSLFLSNTLKHAHALFGSKGSVAYKLAAVSSQALCVGSGRMDKLL